MEPTTFTVERTTGYIGATISGLDVREAQPATVTAQLQQLLHEHGVLFFSAGEPLSDEEHQSFAQWFGEVKLKDEYSKVKDEFNFDTFDAAQAYPTDVWHTDGSTWPHPPQASVLRAVMMPPFGGDTMWASMYAAYEALSSRYQRLIDGLEAEHNLVNISRYFPPEQARDLRNRPGSVHPVVPRDAVTGRPMLYVNELYTDKILGISPRESERLLSFLYEHVNTPEFHVRLRWKSDTLAVWEERITQHRAVRDYSDRRIVKRLEISGPPPSL